MTNRWSRNRLAVFLALVSLIVTAEAGCEGPAIPVNFNESDQSLVIYLTRDVSNDAMHGISEWWYKTLDAESQEYTQDPWGGCDIGPFVARTADGAFVSEWADEELCEGERWTITQEDVDNRSDKVPGLEGPYWTVHFEGPFVDRIGVHVFSGTDHVISSAPIRSDARFFGNSCTSPMSFVAVFDELDESSGDTVERYIQGPTACRFGSTWTITKADLDKGKPWDWSQPSQP